MQQWATIRGTLRGSTFPSKKYSKGSMLSKLLKFEDSDMYE